MKNKIVFYTILATIAAMVVTSCSTTLRIEDTNGYSEGLFCVKQNGKWGYLNKEGEVVIKPIFDEAFPFEGQGIAMVRVSDKWGVIDKKGKYLLQPQYDAILSFGEKYARVIIDEKWGLMKYDGTVTLPAKFDDIENLFDG